MCHGMLCGGWTNENQGGAQTCERFEATTGTFTLLPVELRQRRAYIPCWGLESGDVLLFGGWTWSSQSSSMVNNNVTERVSADGSSSSYDFTMVSPFRRLSCGIAVGDTFVVTGGEDRLDSVVRYTEDGFATSLPSLKDGRHNHACSTFVNDDGETVRNLTPCKIHA